MTRARIIAVIFAIFALAPVVYAAQFPVTFFSSTSSSGGGRGACPVSNIIGFGGNGNAEADNATSVNIPTTGAGGFPSPPFIDLVCAVSTQNISSISSSGWTELNAGDAKKKCWWKYVTSGTEPSSYTVSIATTGDVGGVVASAPLPLTTTVNLTLDDSEVATNTGTQPSATSNYACDTAVIAVLDNAPGSASSNWNTQPSGYSAAESTNNSFGNNTIIGLMYSKLTVGTGTISPGTWGMPGTTSSKLWTILIAPAP